MPQTAQIGDAVLLRGISLTTFSGQVLALSSAKAQLRFLTISSESIPSPSYQEYILGGKQKLMGEGSPGQMEALSLAEQAYIIKLKHDLAEQVTARQQVRALPANVPTGPSIPTKRTNTHDPTLAVNDALPKRPRFTGGFGPKFRLIRDVTYPPCWTDLCGEVIKSFPNSYGIDLYISDYTPNNKMREYPEPDDAEDGDSYNEGTGRDGDYYNYAGVPTKRWPGPWGYNILKVNVKEPHASYLASNVNLGDFVELQNVKMRQAPDGTLEADMWPDHLDASRVQIRKLAPMSGLVNRLQERREIYWSNRQELVRSRHDRDSTKDDQNANGSKLSKAEKKRLRKQKKREHEQAAKATTAGSNGISFEPAQSSTKSGINAHIRCSHDDVPVLSLNKILDRGNVRHSSVKPDATGGETKMILPFINARYRARVRVVDYAPKQLEDFAVLAGDDDDDDDIEGGSNDDDYDYDDDYDDDDDDYEPPESISSRDAHRRPTPRRRRRRRRRWEWRFALQLEDAPVFPTTTKKKNPENRDDGTGGEPEAKEERIWVQLHHEHAQFLFGRDVDDPADLRADPRLKGQLREKLFILWGDLEEVMEKGKGKGKEGTGGQAAGNAGDADADAMEIDTVVAAATSGQNDNGEQLGKSARNEDPPAAADNNDDDEGNVPPQQSSNLPFECCLMEYGVQTEEGDSAGVNYGDEGEGSVDDERQLGRGFGWRRMFALFGTTIL
jgi:hypothetical protein